MKKYEGYDKLTLKQALRKIEELENDHKKILAVSQDPLGYYTVISRNPYPDARDLEPPIELLLRQSA